MGRLKRTIVTLLLFCSTPCSASDSNFIGQRQPAAATPLQAKIELPDFYNPTAEWPSGKTLARILATPVGEAILNVRGPQDIEMYRYAAPSVVLIATDEGLGSGVYVAPHQIVTNGHVVGSARVVAVIFKPQQEGVKISPANAASGTVLRVDHRHDLALVSVASVPDYVHPLPLGTDADIVIGADVHAIGHPSGQMWTYTKGLISQFRKDYEWHSAEGKFRADVVQTQTPINPGNSGGPLIGEAGKLIGVNSFKAAGEGLEGLNFAVSVDDVTRFLNSAGDDKGGLDNSTQCKPAKLYEGRNRSNDARIVLIDTNCDGKANFSLVTPDDASKPISALIDSNRDGKIDIVVEDRDRDGRWDISFHDVDFDSIIDLVGLHDDGKLRPTRYEKYDPKRLY